MPQVAFPGFSTRDRIAPRAHHPRAYLRARLRANPGSHQALDKHPRPVHGITAARHVALITQFETFPKDGVELSLEAIRGDLIVRFPAIFRRLIYYSSRETEWERQLEMFLVQTDIETGDS
jgi:hypothetical protein